MHFEMQSLLLMTALWKVATCDGPTLTPVVTVTQSPPATTDFVKACSVRTARVQFSEVEIDDAHYRRKVLSENDYLCMAGGAVLLDADEFLACAKEAIAKEYNTFYMDAQERCFGSNQRVADDADLCTSDGFVVYTADIPIAPDSMIAPDIVSFSISDVVVNESFVVNFYPSCYGFEYLLLNEELQILGAVENAGMVTSDVTPIPPCTELTFALQTTVDGKAADIARLTSVETPAIPDVVDFSVDTFMVSKSFVIHFTATCPLHYAFQLQMDGEVFDSMTTEQTVRYSVPPCAELVPTLHVLEDGVEVLVVDATVSPTSTPAIPDVTGFYIDPFQNAGSFEVYFDASCPDDYTFNLEFNGQTFGDVSSGQSISDTVSPCGNLTAVLSAIDSAGNAVGSGTYGTVKQIPFSFAELEGTCFLFSEDVATYDEAKTSCPTGSAFATPISASTRQAIKVHLAAELPDSDGWLIDIKRENGVWKYGDGTTETSESGLTAVPDQACARFRTETGYKLEDIYCIVRVTFICQFTG